MARKANFDRDEKLLVAMDVFWKQRSIFQAPLWRNCATRNRAKQGNRLAD